MPTETAPLDAQDELEKQREAVRIAHEANAEEARKAAAAPIAEKLRAYAEALNNVPFPTLQPEYDDLATKIVASVRKLSDQIVAKSSNL